MNYIPVSSRELYLAYKKWRRKANSWFFKGDTTDSGLCYCIGRWAGSDISREMRNQFAAAGLSVMYPFNSSFDWNREQANNVMHLNLNRRDWVDARIADYERYVR